MQSKAEYIVDKWVLMILSGLGISCITSRYPITIEFSIGAAFMLLVIIFIWSFYLIDRKSKECGG
jgi:hypothetical protein